MRFRIPATLILAVSALLSRLLGLVRDHLLARTFGASSGEGIYNLDAYYAAFRIPDLLYNLLIFGAISAAIIPIFTQYKKSGELRKGWEFASNMLHILLIFILLVSAVVYLFAPQFAHLVAGGFEGEAFSLTVRLMRIMLLSPIIFTFSAIFISLQDSFKVFFWRSAAPLFYNLGIIFGILYFAQDFGVVGVTWGVIIGALLQLLVQMPALRTIGYRHVWQADFHRADVRKAIRLIIPRVAGLSLTQITLVFNTLIASFLMTGSITIFYFADNLQAVPLGIIGISFAITSFATLSELAMEKSSDAFVSEIKRVGQQVLFLIVPATLGMLFLRDRIIDVILVAGKFTAGDAAILQAVLAFLLISLFAQSLIPLFSRGFYAYHNTKTPVITAIVGAVVSVGGSYLLAIQIGMGVLGIGVAYSAGNIFNFALLYRFMVKKCGTDIFDWLNVLKMLVAGAVMYGALYLTSAYVSYGERLIDRMGALALLTLVGMLSYFLAARLLKISEFKMITRR
ncbi:murein biosynthesis integral membrane protein MurJ [Candidatus Peregrinibacteria bacterium]|nr:murein biosynthesis integral membrane protein MurJ [Candidatus Peregrinibacteria bacterium]